MNWGTKILLGMAVFMVFILSMVGFMFLQQSKDALIEEDYYEKGIAYNATYNAAQNAVIDQVAPKMSLNNTQVVIALKTPATYQLKMMHAANKADDLSFDGVTKGKNYLILIDRARLAKGIWFVQLSWKANNKAYSFQTNIKL
ncbi:FixH family protein [Pedobacter sandarakinus]|uniref:FixH family protein n=1 Tax=Pedobacter sandarakinus TaxID=353156 RepID=UPI0022458A54|nr:FixH family protein [Pedobacter sandarakinus]MCX2574929.1 FixH family protein [Pedobacter sandarakinus]